MVKLIYLKVVIGRGAGLDDHTAKGLGAGGVEACITSKGIP